MTSLIERAAERLRSETTGKRHLIPADADTPDPLAAAIATAEDYDRFSAGLIGSPPAILATVQRDMAALAAAHMERIRDEPQMDMREAKAIVRIVLAAIRDAFDESGLVGGVRQMAEIEGSESATRASAIYDGVIDWFDAAMQGA